MLVSTIHNLFLYSTLIFVKVVEAVLWHTTVNHNDIFVADTTMAEIVNRVRNCAFLVANATKNFALATRISQLVASGRLTLFHCHDNYTNNSFDFQPN